MLIAPVKKNGYNGKGKESAGFMNFDPEILRKNLQQVMDQRDLSINAWANSAGVSEGTLRTFMNKGRDNITINTIAHLAEAVHMNMLQLLDETYGQDYTTPPALTDSGAVGAYRTEALPTAMRSGAEEVWWMGRLSPVRKCRILTNGELGLDEIERLIDYLESQRDMLLDKK